jgi:serine O-acetyltransferase
MLPALLCEEPISAEVPDWSREDVRQPWDPSRQLLASIRRYQAWKKKSPGPVATAMTKLAVAQHRFWSVVCSADIPINTEIDGGLLNARAGP